LIHITFGLRHKTFRAKHVKLAGNFLASFENVPAFASVSLTVPNFGFEAPVLGNGNFQYGPTGGSWTFANGGGISSTNTPFTGVPSAAPEGVQVAFIQATGTVSQSISGFQANAKLRNHFQGYSTN